MEQTQKQIRDGTAELGLALNKVQIQQLDRYLDLLEKWNKTYNLTAVKRREDMVLLHLLDSLAIAAHISGQSIIDVGSGAGVPGVPLAILYPDKMFVLLDSNGKKTRFLTQVTADLPLENVEVVQMRVEDYRARTFDHVVCRAFAPLSGIAAATGHLLASEGNVLAMKASLDHDLLTGSGAPLRVLRRHTISVPHLDAQRCVVELARDYR